MRQPAWILSIYPIYALIFGILAVPELNSVFALICHQRYSTAEESADRSEFREQDLFKELNFCLGNEDSQADLSQFLIYRQLVPGLLGAISTPVLSYLSDRIGRKRILACTAIGPLIKDVFLLVLLWNPDMMNVHWLLAGYAMEGLSGEIIVAMATSQAYITDLAPQKERARLFSYIQAGTFLSLAIGPIIAGVLLTAFDSFRVIYEFAVCSHSLLFLIFLYILPESRPSSSRNISSVYDTNTDQGSGENGIQSAWASLKSMRSSSSSRQRNMIILGLVDFVVFGALMGLSPLQLAYPAYLFHWNPTTQSFALAFISSWSIIVLIVVFPTAMMFVSRWYKQISHTRTSLFEFGEIGAIKCCLALEVIGFIGISLAQNPGSFVLSCLVVSSAAPLCPLIVSCLMAHVPSHQSGQVLGFLTFVHAISRVTMPSTMNAIYSRTVGMFPAPLFIFLAIIHGVALVATMGIDGNYD